MNNEKKYAPQNDESNPFFLIFVMTSVCEVAFLLTKGDNQGQMWLGVDKYGCSTVFIVNLKKLQIQKIEAETTDRKQSGNYFENQLVISVIFQGNMSEAFWFQFLKCEQLLLFIITCRSKKKMFWLVVGYNKEVGEAISYLCSFIKQKKNFYMLIRWNNQQMSQ